MAKIKQAIHWMRKGRKVTRPCWKENSYWQIDGMYQRIVWADGTNAIVHLNQLEAKDWELWKGKDLSMSDENVRVMIEVLNIYKERHDSEKICIDSIIRYLKN